ncbi:MAG: hypothetical protein M9894_01235 [Planctomycetes bacterium]|nr:hypothetical protein [Planctomycetota bacterium]
MPRVVGRVLLLTLGLPFASHAQVPPWVTGETGLFAPDGAGGWRLVDWRDHATALDAMLEHCCERFQVPFDLPLGTRIIPGEDDKDLTRERTREPGAPRFVHGPSGEVPVPGAQMSHCGLDIGSRVSADGGATIDTLGRAAVSPVHSGGYVRVDAGLIKQRILCEHQEYRLVLEITYGHVAPAPSLGGSWSPTPAAPLGTLDGDDRWSSFDRGSRSRGTTFTSRSRECSTRRSARRWRTTVNWTEKTFRRTWWSSCAGERGSSTSVS